MDRVWVDLSHPIYIGMPHSAPHGEVVIWVDDQSGTAETPIRITHVEMATHIGTHIDAPNHFIPGGKSIEEYPTDRFIGDGVALDLRRNGNVPVTVDDLENAHPSIREGDIVLLHLGYAERFGEPLSDGHPYLSEEAARWLVERRVPIVGVDVLTPDRPQDYRPEGFDWPVHRILLGNDTLVIENLGPRIAEVTGHRLEIIAVPLRIRGGDAAQLVPLARIVERIP